jgi:23S rRNA pseudouridine1911/1915/1917 synthase
VESRSLPVPPGLAGERADAGIAKLLGLSRSVTAQIAEDGGIVVDGITLGKADRLRADAWLEVTWEPRTGPVIEPVVVSDVRIVWDDDDLVVIDKPVGVAAHPSVGWDGPTVLGALAGAGLRISTSGASELKRQFHDHEVTKIYHAVVQGHPDPLTGTIDAPIGRHPRSSWKFAVTADGKDSVTHYETIEAFRSASLLEVQLETGRTHQIRVHMAAQKHPCVGDSMYGADPTLSARLGLSRQWLHAMRLAFRHPASGETVEFTSVYPTDLQHALDVLREG